MLILRRIGRAGGVAQWWGVCQALDLSPVPKNEREKEREKTDKQILIYLYTRMLPSTMKLYTTNNCSDMNEFPR